MSSPITKLAHLQIPLEDVVNATNNFHQDNIIGHGGFGTAYKGQLQRSGKLIKISALRLDRKQGEGDLEFWTEISMLSDLSHTNLVSIIGFCDEEGEKVIITTYAAKGSLENHLNNPNLTWTQRLKICVGVARALSYLHHDEGRGYGVLHLNLNSSSILLDENFEAKLSGFKVSVKQSLKRMDQVILSEPSGTIGYVDPEVEKIKGVTHKSDIYSFGVVLFEILCGRRAYIKNDANKFLAGLARYHYENGTLQDLIYPDLRNQTSPRSLRIYSKMAYSCLEPKRAHRPDIRHIVDNLEEALKFMMQFGKNLEHLRIRLEDIKLATDNFSDTHRVDSNYYFSWHGAELSYFDKEKPSLIKGKSESEVPMKDNIVLVKRFLPIHDNQEKLFFRELEMLTSVKHNNIVTLIGFCVEGSEMMLVVEKFFNGYLRDYLLNVKRMHAFTWEKRLKICIDVAHALSYLHSETEDKRIMIHGNMHCGKIGLDKHWGAKIDDFESAAILPPNHIEEYMHKRPSIASPPHIDSEDEETDEIKRESDVYGFGVVLLEMLCGRHAGNDIYLMESVKGLVHVARRNYSKGTLDDMIDPILKEENGKYGSIPNGGANKKSLDTFSKVAIQCVTKTQDQRPTMKFVLKELEKALLFQEEWVHQPDKDQVVKKLEIATHKIPGTDDPLDEAVGPPVLSSYSLKDERLQQPDDDQVVDEHERASHEILVNNLKHLKIHLADIQLATNNFFEKYKISSRGDYILYKAELSHSGKENPSSVEATVILKRYVFGHPMHRKKRFFRELEMLSTVKHPNIVKLLGFCVERSEMILVIDNTSNGYLVDYLRKVDNMRNLNWEKRLKICIDVAQALKYIHYEMEDQKAIINRDIHSANIGLDENWGAKLVSFWLSVFLSPNREDETEYETTSKVKRESDVYSFGLILFQLLSGRTTSDPTYYTRPLEDLIDPIIKEETNENNFVLNIGPNKDSLHTFFEIAYKCVATQDERPTMKVIVKELEKALLFQKNKDNPKISLEDIKVATQNFHDDNCIGGGRFGRVFKGNLKDGDGFKTIVAKRLDTSLGQGEQQFLTELQILMEYKHKNVIGLIGYCDEQDEKLIVYEYAPRGSLDRYLNNASLTWVKRLSICIDVASALDFFHEGVGKQAKVIHRDIKTANILLNHDWKAKLTDFGLSLISPITKRTEYVIDNACGTHGYMDPLYKKSGFLTIESDIYSFGVVLFEILCGKSTFEIHKQEDRYLPDFIKSRFEEGKYNDLVFKQIRKQIEPKSLTTFQKIAYQCLHDEREKRPTTKEVLTELKKALEFQVEDTMDKDKEGCSGPDDDTLTETVGDIQALEEENKKKIDMC